MKGHSGGILFAPASGPRGTGEYYRCLILARAVRRMRDDIAIDFLLQRDATVERDDRFTYHELSATPAHAGHEVTEHIDSLGPGVVVFDNTGRRHQLRAAHRAGARVVWISSRARKRLKGFRPRLMRWMDCHIVLDSGNPSPALGLHERLLLACFRRVSVDLVQLIVPPPDPAGLAAWLDRLPPPGHALFVAGGGGYRFRGRPASEIFLEAAVEFRRASGRDAVVVMGPQYPGGEIDHPQVTVLSALPMTALGALLERAGLAVIGAGNMLSGQAMAARLPCVMTAAGGRDQPARVRRLAGSGMVVAADLNAADLAHAAGSLAADPELMARLAERVASIEDGTLVVARRLVSLRD